MSTNSNHATSPPAAGAALSGGLPMAAPISQTSAATADTLHRIEGPNSQARHIRVIGIGQGGQQIARSIGAMDLKNVSVLHDTGRSAAAMAGLLDFMRGADMVVIVAQHGDEIDLPPGIRQFCLENKVQITGVLLQPSSAQTTATSADMLARLRASSDMLIIAADESYITDMLVQFGA